MINDRIGRRALLQGGLGVLGLGLLRAAGVRVPTQTATAAPLSPPPPAFWRGKPILELPEVLPSTIVDGMPFESWFSGDAFPGNEIPFHQCERCFPSGDPPAPSEEVEVAVVGGGLSGLCAAYLLRDRDVVLLEMKERFGGNAMGERWMGVPYSLGSAYFIVADRGTFLERIYSEVGVLNAGIVDKGTLEVELKGSVLEDLVASRVFTREEAALVEKYVGVVDYYVNEAYPEIPLPKERNEWILELDQLTLRQDIEKRVGAPLPPLLAAAVQAYCYSSFGVGWDEISAAGGWNFLAAEEYGRVVLPGGNAGLAEGFWRRLRAAEKQPGRRAILRPGHKTVDVRLDGDGVLVTWATPQGAFRSLRAKHVVMANSKHIAKHMLPELASLDEAKFDAMQQVQTAAYMVVNVLLDRPARLPFYDIFLLGDGSFPMTPTEAELDSAVVDVLNGEFASDNGAPSTALTLYWPLPWPGARFTLVTPDAWQSYAESLVPQIKNILDVVGIEHDAVRQVRMSRWGHAMPIPTPGAMAFGVTDLLRRPVADRIWFVNQDNWLLPAVENSLLEAETWTAEIRKRLG